MPRYRPEPAHTHGQPTHSAVLLVNLGTPAAPTAAALRPYLRQFLSDPRVVEIPKPIWWLILNGIILNTRPKKSAAKYASIWMNEGSPLAVHTARQASLLAGYLGERQGEAGRNLKVAWAMRYGEPSIGATLDKLHAEGVRRVLVLPMYPQYSASTTASVNDEVCRWLMSRRNQPEVRLLRNFHDDPGYIAALAASVREHWMREGRGERLVISFHGLPKRNLLLGDPYHCECHKTGRLLAEALELSPEQYTVTFQSRFGRAEWLQPYTQATLERLAREGVGKVDVICPGFVADCIETLEEIAMECRSAFVSAGGQALRYIPCLNERDDWIHALARLVEQQIGDWLRLPPIDPAELAASAQRARQMGAER